MSRRRGICPVDNRQFEIVTDSAFFVLPIEGVSYAIYYPPYDCHAACSNRCSLVDPVPIREIVLINCIQGLLRRDLPSKIRGVKGKLSFYSLIQSIPMSNTGNSVLHISGNFTRFYRVGEDVIITLCLVGIQSRESPDCTVKNIGLPHIARYRCCIT
jgi:hypothetical protein